MQHNVNTRAAKSMEINYLNKKQKQKNLLNTNKLQIHLFCQREQLKTI